MPDFRNPIFHKHRDKSVHSPITVIFPPGAGGHFISTMVNPPRIVATTTNEYKGELRWFDMEHWQDSCWYGTPTIAEMQALENMAMRWYEMAVQDGLTVTAHHRLPLLTSHIFDFTTDQLLQICCDDISMHFCGFLAWYKHLFTPHFSDHEHKLRELISAFKTIDMAKLSCDTYDRMVDEISDHFSQVNIQGTLFSWVYLAYCLEAGLDPTSSENLHGFMHDQTKDGFCLMPSQPITDMPSGSYADHMKLDYSRLFFDLELPSPDWHRAHIASYSQDNLRILEAMLPLLSRHASDVLHHASKDARKRLDAAITRQNISCGQMLHGAAT